MANIKIEVSLSDVWFDAERQEKVSFANECLEEIFDDAYTEVKEKILQNNISYLDDSFIIDYLKSQGYNIE